MDDRLSFDVYAKITNPSCRVKLDVLDSWVSVVVGGSRHGSTGNTLQLWFKEPETVVDLGRELISAGLELAADRAKGRLVDAEFVDCGEPQSGDAMSVWSA
jgi:hypothetical protein